MSSITIAVVAFGAIFAGGLLGMGIRWVLPAHHASEETKEILRLGSGLVGTLAAISLGLLINTSKGTLDTMNNGFTQYGAKVIVLDRVLDNYGPETAPIRGMLRNAVMHTLDRVWPEDKKRHVDLSPLEASTTIEMVQVKMNRLSPVNDNQRQLKSQAIQIAADLAQSRWIMIEQTQQTLPPFFLTLLLFWLTTLFAGFGLLSPRNGTAVAVLFVAALSLAGAIFFITEMSTPITGIIKVSRAPLEKALHHLGR
ncbi:hypothetical protein LPW11_06795 [Geomonas sp. RF6]|uniref:bestrophin-like domain n=1 Tax=Geomonas sp. RF6 TaxID=2897342 RepID=UPI001E60A8E2|nr:hypothetical protein [Geomonas sp. RF6]UFS71895.1 hypothetical protein LPW11_06795 [Geomonas sp. RF6]